MNEVAGVLFPDWLALLATGLVGCGALGAAAVSVRDHLPLYSGNDEHVPAGRLTGLLYGILQLAYLFPGLAITVLAREMNTSADVVQLIQGLSAAGGAAVTGYWLWRRAKLPPQWRLSVSAAVLGSALVALGLAPSVFTFALALVLGAAIAPSSMLVRDGVARQFPGRRGTFLAVSQTWTHTTRGLGGLAFALAILGVLEVSDAIVVLGCAVIGVGVVYACWSRLRGDLAAAASAAPEEAPAPLPLRRLAGSPDLLKALLATVGIYGVFQLLWAELQPRVAALALSDKWASFWVAVFGLGALVSIPWIRKHSRQSDTDATRSAAEASRILVAAAAFGLLSLLTHGLWTFVALAVLAVYAGLVEVGGNATSAPVTKALSVLDPRAVLLSALARHVATALGGVIAAAVAWTQAVWWSLGFAAVTWYVLRRWEEHPVEGDHGWISGPFDELRFRLTRPDPGSTGAPTPTAFMLEIGGRRGSIGPWAIWRRDTVEAKAPLRPEVSRSERIPAFRIRFDWALDAPEIIGRTRGRLKANTPVPLNFDGERRGTLRWHFSQRPGRWYIDATGATVLQVAGLADLEFVHRRHGSG